MYRYSAFGFSIASEIELANMQKANGSSDVFIKRGSIKLTDAVETDSEKRQVRIHNDRVGIRWDQVGSVEIRSGEEIIIDAAPGADEDYFRQIAQNIAMGVVLHQRGVYTLHGSAVDVNGQAAVFLGWKGAGKSTTASALYATGHSLITDDVVAIDDAEGGFSVRPGIPSMKLWPEAVQAALREDPASLPQVFQQTQKRVRTVVDNFAHQAVPLGCVYMLEFADEDDDSISIIPMSPKEALIELVSQSYALRFLGNKGVSPHHFQQSLRLAKQVPIRRLRRPRALVALPELVSAIEADMNACSTQAIAV